jgi:hypothetical protein
LILLAEEWIRYLALEVGVTFIRLKIAPGVKKPVRKFEFYHNQKGALGYANALKWSEEPGFGVGVLLDPAKGLWILDADTEQDFKRGMIVCDLNGIAPAVVRTKRGAHFYFLLPEGFPVWGLKAHWCHKATDEAGNLLGIDFKFGPNSFVVAPGTLRTDSVPYEPLTPWVTPPVADPRLFCHDGEFWHPIRSKVVRLVTGGDTVGVSSSLPDYEKSNRSLNARRFQAQRYIDRKAPVSVSGNGGRSTLLSVVVYLVVYLGIEEHEAFEMLTSRPNSWNSRCRRLDGSPYPWSKDELWAFLKDARNHVPAFGVKKLEETKMKRMRSEKLTHMVEVLRSAVIEPGARVPVFQVRELFERQGLPELNNTELGLELTRQGVPRLLATKKRVMCIQGLDLGVLESLLVSASRHRWSQQPLVCPLVIAVQLISKAS